MKRLFLLFGALLGASMPSLAGAEPETMELTLEPAFPKLKFKRPLFLLQAPGRADRMFVVEQDGRVQVFENRPDVESKKAFLDIKSKTSRHFEECGLLGMAFHPKYAENGYFYVYYSDKGSVRKEKGVDHMGVISRFQVSKDDPDAAAPESETVILRVPQPYSNHNGGGLLFGPDGCLYFGSGDGGAANDPPNNGQKLGTLLGKMLRIDVDHPGEDRAYGIPKDNPFVGREGARPEIWAWGLRNPWRFSFDRKTGELWCGDVGQNRIEEIDIVEKGKNYGWRLKEGSRKCRWKEGTDEKELVDPVWEYDQSKGGRSITGGYVYRGKQVPSLAGLYVCADYTTGKMWALAWDGTKVSRTYELDYQGDIDHILNISSFGEDLDGELYVLAFDGRVYRFKEPVKKAKD